MEGALKEDWSVAELEEAARILPYGLQGEHAPPTPPGLRTESHPARGTGGGGGGGVVMSGWGMGGQGQGAQYIPVRWVPESVSGASEVKGEGPKGPQRC